MKWRERRRREQEDADETRHQARVANILGLSNTTGADQDLVGWMLWMEDTTKGAGHLCINCSPTCPPDYAVVYRTMLAARLRCVRCGKILEGTER